MDGAFRQLVGHERTGSHPDPSRDKGDTCVAYMSDAVDDAGNTSC